MGSEKLLIRAELQRRQCHPFSSHFRVYQRSRGHWQRSLVTVYKNWILGIRVFFVSTKSEYLASGIGNYVLKQFRQLRRNATMSTK